MISRNSDLIRQKSSNSSSSTSSSTNHQHPGFQMTVENNNQQQPPPCRQQSVHSAASKSVDDVWKEVCKQEAPDEMMTLEDFLAKAEAIEEDDVKIQPPGLGIGLGLGLDLASGGGSSYDIQLLHPPNNSVSVSVDGGGIGKRRAVVLETLDKAAQQRQRRMIKNRESAARSRERKQAYQVELESLALKLEQENHTLLKLKTEQTRKRYKQLMDSIIPVTEKQRPTRYVLRKVRSMEW